MTDGLLEGIGRWVESSGRALEMRVARVARRHGARPVELSFAYDDPDQGVRREGDVLASFPWKGSGGADCSIQLVVECKNSTDKPWVGFYDGRLAKLGELNDWVYYAEGPFFGPRGLSKVWAETPTFLQHEVASHVVTSHSTDRNPAGDAIRQVLSATRALAREHRVGEQPVFRGIVLIPAIVTTARLIGCWLGSDDNVQLREVDQMTVRGHRPDGSPCRVYIFTERRFIDMARDLDQCATIAMEEARSSL